MDEWFYPLYPPSTLHQNWESCDADLDKNVASLASSDAQIGGVWTS
jgi:hypothetical protein